MTEVLEHFVNSNKAALINIYNTEKDKLDNESVLLINYENIEDIKVTIGSVETLDNPIKDKLANIKQQHDNDISNIYAVCFSSKTNVNIVLMK